jgi:hypothetical protein
VIGLKFWQSKRPAKGLALNPERADVSDKGAIVHL